VYRLTFTTGAVGLGQNLDGEPSSDHLGDADTLTQQRLDAAHKEGIRSDEISRRSATSARSSRRRWK
jgi:hypothetical protein